MPTKRKQEQQRKGENQGSKQDKKDTPYDKNVQLRPYNIYKLMCI